MSLTTKATAAAERRRIPLVRALVSVACLLGAGVVAGCEDAGARQRTEAQQTITLASTDFRKATAGTVAPGDEHYEQRQRELNAVVSRVSNLPNAEPGQQAAGSLLAAEALSELGSMHLSHAQLIERENRQDRRAISSTADAAVRLHARATAQAEVSTSAERASLQRERQATEQALSALQQRVAALSSPIQDRAQRNAAGEADADRLRTQANDLIRRAIELGHANGFQSFQQAISARRDADGIDYEIALRELELEYELRPEHDLAAVQIEHLQSSIESIRRTLDEFDRLEHLLGEDLTATRRRVDELRRNVTASMGALNARVSGELTDQFETARGYLERAASQARQAAGRLRGDQADAARMVQAKAHESLGQASWAQANAIGEHLNLLTQLVEAGEGIGNTAEFRAKFDSLSESRRRLIEETSTAFTEAEQALDGIMGRAAQAADQFRQNLQRVSSAVQGGEIGPAPAAPRAAASSGGMSPSSPAGGGQGFASVQEAVSFLSSFDFANRGDVDRLFNAVDVSTPEAAETVRMIRSMLDAIFDLDDAIRGQFGETSMASDFGAPEFANPRIAYEGSDRATIAFDTDMGEDTMDLLHRNGQWFIDSSDLVDDLPGGDQMDAEALHRIVDSMTNAFSNLARRVRNGEFQTLEQLEQAIGQVMMQMMMQAFQ